MNQVILIGNLGKDLERREIGDKIIARGTLATRRNREATDWHNITIWGRAAETALEYCRKGSRIACIGSLNYSVSEREDGSKSYFTEINVNQIELLSTKAETEATPKDEEEETADEFLERIKPQPKKKQEPEQENDLPF